MNSDGDLFGTTQDGGGAGAGTVFELKALTPQTTSTTPVYSPTITSLYAFDPANGTDGAHPQSTLFIGTDSGGNTCLYGTTIQGGTKKDGTVFGVDVVTQSLTTSFSFDGPDGAQPQGALIADPGADASGDLYGTTTRGGNNNEGTIFRLTTGATPTLGTLASFDGANGALPVSGVVADSTGNLFGTALRGGTDNIGTVFELDLVTAATTTSLPVYGNAPTVLASFDGSDGSLPEAGLLTDSAGNLYGTTYTGGASNGGAVYEVGAGSTSISLLASFKGTTAGTGTLSWSNLIEDANGNFFGTTSTAGTATHSGGTVFMVTKAPTPTIASFSPPASVNAPSTLTLTAVNVTPGTIPTSITDPVQTTNTIKAVGFYRGPVGVTTDTSLNTLTDTFLGYGARVAVGTGSSQTFNYKINTPDQRPVR